MGLPTPADRHNSGKMCPMAIPKGKTTRTAAWLVLLAPGVFLLPRLIMTWLAAVDIYPLSEVPPHEVVIVFGAGLRRDGSPTAVLHDRVATAAQLYFSGKAKTLLMSGSLIPPYYDEPEAMRRHALSLGVPPEAIQLDPAGFRTYETCYRARHLYGVQRAILVTQAFHLPRALYLCRGLGIAAVGVAADLRRYSRPLHLYWSLREIPAAWAALYDLHIASPKRIKYPTTQEYPIPSRLEGQ